MFKMSTTGRGACVQTFAKVVNSFVDCCLWQVIPDLLQCTFKLWNGLGLWVKFVKCLKHCTSRMLIKRVEVW